MANGLFDTTRFRSFAERYVIERAKAFKNDTDFQDPWTAVEMAKKIYYHIERVGNAEAEKCMVAAQEGNATEQNASTPGPQPGIAGPPGYPGPQTQPGQTLLRRLHALSSQRKTSTAGAAQAPLINSQSWTGRKTP